VRGIAVNLGQAVRAGTFFERDEVVSAIVPTAEGFSVQTSCFGAGEAAAIIGVRGLRKEANWVGYLFILIPIKGRWIWFVT